MHYNQKSDYQPKNMVFDYIFNSMQDFEQSISTRRAESLVISSLRELPYPDFVVLKELRQRLLEYDVNGISFAMGMLEISAFDKLNDLTMWLSKKIDESEYDIAETLIADLLSEVPVQVYTIK